MPDEYVVITPVPEGSSFYYTGTLVQGNGQPIPNGSLVTLKLTINDESTGAIVNGRNATNVLNLNGVTVNLATGVLVWTPDPLDNPIVNKNPNLDDGKLERHVAILAWTWTDGARTLASQRKIFIDVEKYAGTGNPNEAGSGADTMTMHFDDGSGQPNVGAEVWLTTDALGQVRASGTLTTNSEGNVIFKITDGNAYYLWLLKPGFAPIQGQFFTAVKD